MALRYGSGEPELSSGGACSPKRRREGRRHGGPPEGIRDDVDRHTPRGHRGAMRRRSRRARSAPGLPPGADNRAPLDPTQALRAPMPAAAKRAARSPDAGRAPAVPHAPREALRPPRGQETDVRRPVRRASAASGPLDLRAAPRTPAAARGPPAPRGQRARPTEGPSPSRSRAPFDARSRAPGPARRRRLRLTSRTISPPALWFPAASRSIPGGGAANGRAPGARSRAPDKKDPGSERRCPRPWQASGGRRRRACC